MKWVIQNNNINKEDPNNIQNICINQGYDYELISVIPFSTELPNIDNKQPVIFYGATNFISNIHKSRKWVPGTFFNPDKFTMRSYVENYKEHMFNYPCEFTTIGEFSASNQPYDKLFFIRPVKDLKEFAGEVMEFEKIIRWEKNIRHLPGCDNNPDLTTKTEIIVSEPYAIAHEWRVFVVNGKVSSGSHYRSYMNLEIKNDLPDKVIKFVEEICKIWTPSDVFVMDIGESSEKLFVVECNCFNSCGFYKSDVEKIIVDISNYVLCRFSSVGRAMD
jgi:hypothetical protein